MNKNNNEHIDSYYAASTGAFPIQASLSESLECDVCVVGAGIAGLAAALELAERGYRVVILEAARIGWGASGRSGGQMIFGYACEMETLEHNVGNALAVPLWNMSLEALDWARARIARHGIACDFAPGHLHAALKPRQAEDLKTWQETLGRRYGYTDLEYWSKTELGENLASERYCAGLYDPNSFHVHPLKYTQGLARAALAAGVRIFEQSRVTGIVRGLRPLARTAGGEVRCRQLLLCGNAYIGNLVPEIWRTIMPVGTYISATRPLGEARARSLIANNMAVADMNFVLDYYRLSADHRLLFGGRVSYSTFDPPALAASMRRRMQAVFPQLSDVDMEYTWGGYVDITVNRAPHFGRLDDNLYFVQGFSGHGMALTGLAGKLMAESIHGESSRFDLFGRIRHMPFPGGAWFRTPALVLAMAWYRLRDWL